MDKGFSQYLQHYAEPEIQDLISYPPALRYQYVLVVPAYRESIRFLNDLLNSPCIHTNSLVILVINQPNTDTETAPQQQLFRALCDQGRCDWQAGNLSLVRQTHCDLLLVDRFHQAIPKKQGVGLARKIGVDLALKLIDQGIIQSHWICCTDADARLPGNYFSVLETLSPDLAGACYAFKHSGGEAAIEQATQLYEQALHYYAAGLACAGSPYHFLALGSTLLVQAKAYATVRGFPKRAAGEDFYLLNKLIKIGTVRQISTASIRLHPRLSDRVPFGTGVSSAKILDLQQQGRDFTYYHPQCFYALKQVLQAFPLLWEFRTQPHLWLNQFPPVQAEALRNLGIERFIKSQQQIRDAGQFNQQLHHWFDALKTLRFIHWMRDKAYADITFLPEDANKIIGLHSPPN